MRLAGRLMPPKGGHARMLSPGMRHAWLAGLRHTAVLFSILGPLFDAPIPHFGQCALPSRVGCVWLAADVVREDPGLCVAGLCPPDSAPALCFGRLLCSQVSRSDKWLSSAPGLDG